VISFFLDSIGKDSHFPFDSFDSCKTFRYIFCNGGEKCSLQEIGPRFTLKLRWMQAGIIDGKKGLFEFKWKADSQTNRKVLFL
jgi:hypothetical protein